MKGAGLFVTFEGIEGSGKTTQVRRAARAIRARGFPVVATRQPGGTPLGARLRRILLRSADPIDARAELLLMVADRRQHLSQVIEPALSTGSVVLCDRDADASGLVEYPGSTDPEGEADADSHCVPTEQWQGLTHTHLPPSHTARTHPLTCPSSDPD